MDASSASWVALTAIVGILTGGYLVQKTEKQSPLELMGAVLVLLGAACSVVMVFQGFHLWNSGWEGIPMEPETAGRMAAKARGRGGIILLIIQFFPQFLVFSYGGLLWQTRYLIRYSANALGLKFER